jgi:HTH-type transcriptional regulator/antitoxin HipB
MTIMSQPSRPTWTVRSGEDLGKVVAEIRARRGLTQEQLAVRGGLSRAYLAQIERGRTGSLIEHILRLLRRMGATITVTLDGDGNP